jgi:hypothetical protein
MGAVKTLGPAWLFMALVLVMDVGSALTRVVGEVPAVVTAAALVVIAAGWLRAAREHADRPSEPPHVLIVAVILGTWVANVYFLRKGYEQVAVVAAGGVALLTCLVLQAKPRVVVWVCVIAGLALRIVSFRHVPIDPADGDQLPIVQGAIDHFLRGEDPYVMYHFPWELPLVYLPGTWLWYVPAQAAGIDLRVVNLLFELGTGAIVWRVSRRAGTPVALLLWAWTFVDATFVQWSLHVTHYQLWFFTLAAAALCDRGRHAAGALCLGAALAASPLAIVIAPFIGLLWIRQRGFVRALGYGMAGLACTAAVVAPFAVWDLDGLLLGVFRWHNENDRLESELVKLVSGEGAQVGFTSLFYRAGAIGILKPLQVVVLAAACVYTWLAPRTMRAAACVAAGAMLLFMMINPMIHLHYYWLAGVLGLWAVAAGRGQGSNR